MAKKKKEEINLEDGPQTIGEESPEVKQFEANGIGVGLYYDESLKKYVLVTLSLCPTTDNAIITNKKLLKASKLGAVMETEVALKQLLQKELK